MRPVHKNMLMARDILPHLRNKERVAFLGSDYAFKNMRALLICIGASAEDIEYFFHEEPGEKDGMNCSKWLADEEIFCETTHNQNNK